MRDLIGLLHSGCPLLFTSEQSKMASLFTSVSNAECSRNEACRNSLGYQTAIKVLISNWTDSLFRGNDENLLGRRRDYIELSEWPQSLFPSCKSHVGRS